MKQGARRNSTVPSSGGVTALAFRFSHASFLEFLAARLASRRDLHAAAENTVPENSMPGPEVLFRDEAWHDFLVFYGERLGLVVSLTHQGHQRGRHKHQDESDHETFLGHDAPALGDEGCRDLAALLDSQHHIVLPYGASPPGHGGGAAPGLPERPSTVPHGGVNAVNARLRHARPSIRGGAPHAHKEEHHADHHHHHHRLKDAFERARKAWKVVFLFEATGKNVSTSLASIDEVRLLALFLWKSRALRRLNLEGEELGPAAAPGLASLVLAGLGLRTLSVRRNNLGSKGAEVLAKALLSPGCVLQDLDLAANDLGFVGARTIAKALASNRTPLRELDLSENCVGEDGALSLWEALSANQGACKLLVLHLGANRISGGGDHGCFLAEALRMNGNLTQLDLSWNKFGDAGARHISEGLGVNEGLVVLELRGCEIRDTGLVHLLRGLHENERLEDLDLRDNVISSLPTTFRQSLELSWIRLRRLRLEGNQRLGEAMAELAARAVQTREKDDWDAVEAERRTSAPLPTLAATQPRNASRGKSRGGVSEGGLDGIAPPGSRPWEMHWSEEDGRFFYMDTKTGVLQAEVPGPAAKSLLMTVQMAAGVDAVTDQLQLPFPARTV